MKHCKRCNTDRPLTEFSKNKTKRDGLQSTCKLCTKVINNTYYKNTPERNAERAACKDRARLRNRTHVLKYLATHPCVDCGEKDPIVLEFDHVRGTKKNNISELLSWGSTLSRLEAEIEKCEVRCANCHRRVTATRGGWAKVLESVDI